MSVRSCFPVLALLLVLISCIPAAAAEGSDPAKDQTVKEPDQSAQSVDPAGKLSVTNHTFSHAGQSFEYTATAGYLKLRDESGKPKADIFFTAYTMNGSDAAARPVTFLFNGGPGASSAWLHLGIAGPVRVITGEKSPPTPPPYAATPNGSSWLPWSDLVFIDPVGTGFSRAIPPGEAKPFYNTRDDIRWAGDFIRLYTTRFGRWASPKCLAGESYGAMRAAGLLRQLYEDYGMEIDGLVMISPALDLDTIQFDAANDLPYVLFLPSYTAAAWHHGKIAPELKGNLGRALAESEKWAFDNYLPALAKGDLLPEAEKNRLAAQYSKFTGLPEQLVRNRGLRLTRPDFTAELLRPEGLLVGIMDARTVKYGKGGGFLSDPGMAATIGPYTGAINRYLNETLKFAPGIPYITFSEEVNSQWNWGPMMGSYVDAVDSIRVAVNRNKRLKILAAAGYFDLDVPYFATTYIMSHIGVEPGLRDNVRVRFFPGGHMFYISDDALEAFAREAAGFFAQLRPSAR
ncbi:MAG: peptidase S10 [Syntrophobacter sp.]